MLAAFAYHLDAASPGIQSGRPCSLLRNLRALGLEIEELFPLRQPGTARRLLRKLWSLSQGRRYLLDRDEALLRSFARQVEEALPASAADFIFSPSTLPLSFLETDLPVTFCSDAPFCAMVDYYESFTGLDRRQFELAERLEAGVVQKAALAVYPTRWAADHAIHQYGVDPSRTAVIPFGANCGSKNKREEVAQWIARRKEQRPLRLLFVGREWERKGGDMVMGAARWLVQRGVPVQVDLVGCTAPKQFRTLSYVQSHGLVGQSNAADRRLMHSLYQQAHVVFVPSRAEAYGMTFCEANAFGVPVLTSATGGLGEVVRTGINGTAMPLDAEAEDYGRWIEETCLDPQRYATLAASAFEEFASRLNWQTHCRTFLQRVKEGAASSARRTSNASPSSTDGPAASISSSMAHSPPPANRAQQEPLQVVFLADGYTDPQQISSWSGTPHFALRALERQGLRFTVVHLNERSAWIERWTRFLWHRLVHRRRYLRDRNPRLLRSYNKKVQARLRELHPDIIFAMATAPLAFLQAECPIAFWVDATFAGMSGFYGSFTGLAGASLREGEAADRAALRRASLAIYSSEWAAETARDNYSVDPKRVHFVNLGANLESTPAAEEIPAIVDARDFSVCRLLFIGVDWVRKGAELAIAAAACLEKIGIPVRLKIIGCHPPNGYSLPSFVEIGGFISKQTEEGAQRLEQCFREAHFFILPTRAEAYGMVFCEASAYGVPSLAPRLGGIASIIEEGENGWLFAPEAPPTEYAECVAAAWRDPASYRAMGRRCQQVYQRKLNWDAAAARVSALMHECVGEYRRRKGGRT